MKKNSLLLVILPLAFAACGPTDNEVDIVQAQSVIEAARAAQDAAQAAQIASQGLSDVGRGQTTILLLLTQLLQQDQDELAEADLDSPQLPDGWW